MIEKLLKGLFKLIMFACSSVILLCAMLLFMVSAHSIALLIFDRRVKE